MTTLGVIGNGILGKAISRGFMEMCEVKVFDVVREKATHSLEEAASCDVVMIALPSPAKIDGSCDTSAIEGFLCQASAEFWWRPESCMVLRSTVPIGFTQRQAEMRNFRLPLLHSPEFLTARCAQVDFQTPARNIVGVPCAIETDARAIQYRAHMKLIELYERRFPGVQVFSMPSNASELVKLACNTFFASKVTLFNMFAEIAKAAGVDWEDVRAGIMSDGRISHSHTAVGQGGIPGFGGTCLPKDMADLYISAINLGVDAEIIREVLARNDRIRRPFDASLTRIELPGRDTKTGRTP